MESKMSVFTRGIINHKWVFVAILSALTVLTIVALYTMQRNSSAEEFVITMGERIKGRPLDRSYWQQSIQDAPRIFVPIVFAVGIFCCAAILSWAYCKEHSTNDAPCITAQSAISWVTNRQKYVPYILAYIPLTVAVLRAICSPITQDETFTYMFWALRTVDEFNVRRLFHMFISSNANNHLLNSLLIALVTKLTNVRYNEAIIRIPIMVFAFLYYTAAARCLAEKEVNIAEFSLLCFSYYMNEYFGLARGYGMAAYLVLVALIFFKKYLVSLSFKSLWVCIYLFILSAYAASVTLLLIFAVGAVAIADLAKRKLLIAFMQQWAFRVVIAAALLAVILYYHWRVTSVENELYLFRADSVNFIFYTRQYLYFVTHCKTFSSIVLWILSVSILIVFVCSILIAKGKHCELSIALMIHTTLMFCIPLIFRRGTLTERLLVPSYPLVVLGTGEMVRNCCNFPSAHLSLYRNVFKAICITILIAMFCNFIHNVDYLHTVYSFAEGDVRPRYRHGERIVSENTTNKGRDDRLWPYVWKFYERQDEYFNRPASQ